MALNVETYQLSKKDKQVSSGSGGVSQEVLDRLDTLESNQNTILGEYFFDFIDDRFIDLYRSTVIKSGSSLIPRQYINLHITGLDKNDDCIDYDKSTGIKYYNNHVSLLNVSTLSGELYLFPIKITEGSVGIKFHSNFANKSTTGQSDATVLSDGRLWFTSGVDNIGRLWIIRMNQYETSDTNAYLDIYEPNMTLIKTIPIVKSNIIGRTETRYNFYFEASNMIFLEDNTCILTVRRSPYIRNGLTRDYTWSGYWNDDSRVDLIMSIKDDGTIVQLYSAAGYYYNNNSDSAYPYYQYGSSQNLMEIKNGVLFFSGGTYAYRAHYQTNDANMNRNVIGIDIRNLNSISLRENKLSFPNRPDGLGNRWLGNSIIQSNLFVRNSYFYNFVTSVKRIDSPNKISDLYSFQCGFDLSSKRLYSDTSETKPNQIQLLDEAEDPDVIYTHPGFNGIYYNTSNNKLYVFGNGKDTRGMIRCYDIDWTSRIDGKLKVKKILERIIDLKASSWGAISSDTTMNSSNCYPTYEHRGYQSNPWQYMKIIDFKGALHLFYYAPQSPSISNLCLKYMCVDYELNQVIDETILNRQNDKPDMTNNIAHFEVKELNDELIILISRGNAEEYTADLNNPANKAKTIEFFKIDLVESTVKFYYLNESNNTWIEIQNNATVLFDHPTDYVKIKAALRAGNYGSSPRIDDFTIQSWTNGNDKLRWSEYYSNKIDCLQGNGKAVIHVDQDEKDGVINWFISFDGGKNYSPLTLDEEFAYTHLEAVDCRLKAVIGTKDNSDKIPQINSYTIKTNHIVFHTDLEEIQINLIKTNFKIDTYTNASRNGLLKMTIDTLSDDNNIDKAKSDYHYLPATGSVAGNYIQTIPEDVIDNIKTVLLVVDEVLENGAEIDYFISVDGGISFKKVKPNIKTQITNTNSSKCSLVLKAVMKGNARLSAWGIAWN